MATRSIKTTVPLAVVLPAVLGIGITGALCLESSRRSVQELSSRLRNEVIHGIVNELGRHMDVPQRLVEINAAAIANGQLSPTDHDAWRLQLLRPMATSCSSAFPGTRCWRHWT